MKREFHPTWGWHDVLEIPGNCQNRDLYAADACKAPHQSHPDCDCRWCVYNKEFNKAVNNKAVVEEDEEE